MLLEITPNRFRCSLGACPAVFQQEDQSLVIIGKKADPSLSDQLKDRIAPDEEVIIIRPELLETVKKMIQAS